MKKTLKAYLNDRIREVGRASGDSEKAHALEDELREFVLRKIAEGRYGEASELAEMALETNKYRFERWCA